MMDSSYVKEMERLANEGLVVECGELKFSSRNMKPIYYEPRPAALAVRGLTAIRDYIAHNRDGLNLKDLILHVESHKTVALLSKLSGVDRQRDAYLRAEFDGNVFEFEKFTPTEKFIIALNALFLPSSGRDDLLKFIASIKVENENEIIDTGVSQTTKVRVGIKGGLTQDAVAPSRVVLVPYRTFREIEQPESEFVFRMRQGNSGVEAALFEADGGAWKAVAIERIAKWAAEQSDLKGLAVLA